MLATIKTALGLGLSTTATIITPVRQGVTTRKSAPELWFELLDCRINNDSVYYGNQGHGQFVRQNGNPITVDEGHFRLLLEYCDHYDTQDLPDHIITTRTLFCYPTK